MSYKIISYLGLSLVHAGLLEVVRPDYEPTAPVTTAVDPTRFLCFFEAYTGQNSIAIWRDLSGNDSNLNPYPGSAAYEYAVSAHTGKNAFINKDDGSGQNRAWQNQNIVSNAADEYTVYFCGRPSAQTRAYLALLADPVTSGRGYTYLVSHQGEQVALYQTGNFGTNNSQPADVPFVMVYRLKAGAASVLVNNVVVQSGLNYTKAAIKAMILFNQSANYAFLGEIYGFAIARGIDSDADIQALSEKWAVDNNFDL